ncbi:MAG: hypothetical protein Q4F83_09310 [Eubacteriales bacterium]|nr:hypothetical protein [Eubacteriales bacterium]
MRDEDRKCNCVRQCPCYPNCDQMMEGQMPPTWARQTPEREDEQDWQRMKEMFPDMAKIILTEVEKVCDSMEYEGSMMFDTIPDRSRVLKMTEDIYDKVKDRYPVEETADQDDMFVMNHETRRRRPPKDNWLGDFIQVLLYQEMFQRRCRHRNCRRW